MLTRSQFQNFSDKYNGAVHNATKLHPPQTLQHTLLRGIHYCGAASPTRIQGVRSPCLHSFKPVSNINSRMCDLPSPKTRHNFNECENISTIINSKVTRQQHRKTRFTYNSEAPRTPRSQRSLPTVPSTVTTPALSGAANR